MKLTLSILLIALTSTILITTVSACNEVFCASVVSKCMLTQACKCDIARSSNNCTCCADCAKCLGQHFERCCNCLGKYSNLISNFHNNNDKFD